MCKWGTETLLEVTIPAELSHTGQARQKVVGIDSCIAPIVKALNDAGVTTVACCCGHGKAPGSIILADGREILIAANWDDAREMCDVFDIHGKKREPGIASLAAEVERLKDERAAIRYRFQRLSESPDVSTVCQQAYACVLFALDYPEKIIALFKEPPNAR